MTEKHWVDKNHYRVVSEDGRKSWLYEADDSILSPLIRDECVEVAVHHPDGTTTAYEYNSGLFGERGDPK